MVKYESGITEFMYIYQLPRVQRSTHFKKIYPFFGAEDASCITETYMKAPKLSYPTLVLSATFKVNKPN